MGANLSSGRSWRFFIISMKKPIFGATLSYGDENFGGANIDFIIFEKTDGNQTDPDGGFCLYQ